MVRFDFALWTWRAGDAAGARDLFATLLPVIERVSGPRIGTPWHAQPRLFHREAGDAAGARDQYAALLPVEERVLGPKHATQDVRDNLAYWTRRARQGGA